MLFKIDRIDQLNKESIGVLVLREVKTQSVQTN